MFVFCRASVIFASTVRIGCEPDPNFGRGPCLWGSVKKGFTEAVEPSPTEGLCEDFFLCSPLCIFGPFDTGYVTCSAQVDEPVWVATYNVMPFAEMQTHDATSVNLLFGSPRKPLWTTLCVISLIFVHFVKIRTFVKCDCTITWVIFCCVIMRKTRAFSFT